MARQPSLFWKTVACPSPLDGLPKEHLQVSFVQLGLTCCRDPNSHRVPFPLDAGDNVHEARASDRAVDRAIKRAARLAGLQDRGFSGHSLRAGLATQAALNGHKAADIARQTGHRSLDTVLGYIRVATRFEGNVTQKIGL